MTDRYHHGDLPNTLRSAAIEVITEKGLGNFSLREVARRAGVSHAAPAHHFGDMAGLLTAIAVDAMHQLYEATDAARRAQSDPIEALIAVGKAYVEIGMRHPACNEVAFRCDLVDADSPAFAEAGNRAHGVLTAALVDVRDAYNPALDVDTAALHCWATMQGLLVLYPALQRKAARTDHAVDDAVELAERVSRLIVSGLGVTP